MIKPKRLVAAGLVCLLVLSFAACSNSSNVKNTGAPAAKTGYSVVSKISDVTETTLTIDSVCAGVLVDADGKIIDCKIDQAQIKPDLAQNDGDVTDLRTKLEKKEDYSLKSASSIEKEWYEQIAVFEAFAKGKNADEITGCVSGNGYASDADLKAGCTINISDISKAVADAVKNAQDLGAVSTDTLSLAVSTEKSNNSNGTNLQFDLNYAVVTLDSNDRITSCLIDASQAKCAVNKGKFTVEDSAFPTKKELKEDYALKEASSIHKEWYEQAAAFEMFSKGKTALELAHIVGADGYSSDADLKAGCTIAVDSIVSNVSKAAIA